MHKPLEPFMHNWDIVQCADHHFRCVIYVTNTAPSGLENSKTSKHKTKPTFKTYHFHLMLIIYMSFTSRPKQDKSKGGFVIGEGRNYRVTWEPGPHCLYKQEELDILVEEEHY